MIRSIYVYNEAKSRVKYLERLSDDFRGYLRVRQGESLSPFLFIKYVNDMSTLNCVCLLIQIIPLLYLVI